MGAAVRETPLDLGGRRVPATEGRSGELRESDVGERGSIETDSKFELIANLTSMKENG